jgi:hypothetical protein
MIAAALIAALSALQWTVAGVVVDPQRLAVSGVRVQVACDGGRSSVAVTDASGRFSVAPPSERGTCVLTAAHDGFAPFEQALESTIETVTIRLRLADVVEEVTVAAPQTDLRSVAGNAENLIRHLRASAGGSMLPSVVYVDGLPADSLPPIETIARISIDADPFSAERADGDTSAIEITTRAPARELRYRWGTDMVGFGGADGLSSTARSASRFGTLTISGPVPRTRLTFAVNANVGRTSADVPVEAVLPDGSRADAATTTNRFVSGGTDVYYASSSRPLTARGSYRESRTRGSNLGAGGLVLEEAGASSSFIRRETRITIARGGSTFVYEGGAVMNRTDSATRANTDNRRPMPRERFSSPT